MTYTKDKFSISTDRSQLDISTIREFLSQRSYWATGVPMSIMQKAIENSLCFGVYDGTKLVGFARVITDYATFGYLADVFILEDYRGKGLSKWLMECVMRYPDLQRFRRWMLATRDAHELYRKFGFTELKHPERLMEIVRPEIYLEDGFCG